MLLKKQEIFPQISCTFMCAYYTLKGWKYSTGYLGILLMIALIFGLMDAFSKMPRNYKQIIWMLPTCIVAIYKMTLSGDTRLIAAIVAIFIGMNIKFERIAGWILKTKILIFLIAFAAGGYVHLNYLSMNIGVILLLVMYITYPHSRLKALGLGLVILVFGVLISKSGSMLICGGVGFILYVTLNTKMVQNVLTSKAMILLFPGILFINWLLAALYAAYGYLISDFNIVKLILPEKYSLGVLHVINTLNRFLSGRINLAAFSMGKFGFSLWGGNIDYTVDTGLPYFLVDSGMILLLQEWGIIISVIIMLLFVFLMRRLVKEKKYRLIMSAIIIALWAFNEDTLMSVGTNYLFYVIGNEIKLLSKNRKIHEWKKIKI